MGLVVAIGFLALGFWLLYPGAGVDRAERAHSIQLPSSVSLVEASGTGAIRALDIIGLDRTESTLIRVSRSDLEKLLEEFTIESSFRRLTASNTFTPDVAGASEAWLEAESFEVGYRATSASKDGPDFSVIYVYAIGEQQVGVWIYSDWN